MVFGEMLAPFGDIVHVANIGLARMISLEVLCK